MQKLESIFSDFFFGTHWRIPSFCDSSSFKSAKSLGTKQQRNWSVPEKILSEVILSSIFLNQSSEWWMLKFTLAEELSTNSKLSPSLLLDLANSSVGIIPNNWPKYPHARARVPTMRNRTKFWSRTKAIGFCPKYSKKTDTQFSSKLGWTNSPIGNILSMLLSDLTRQHGWYGFVEHTWTNSI